MRNIAVTILALVALAFGEDSGCLVWENADWCVETAISKNHMSTYYGGPSDKINKMLNYPCGDVSVAGIMSRSDISETYMLLCEDRTRGLIKVDGHENIIVVYDAEAFLNEHRIIVKHVIGGDRPRKAYQLVKKTVKYIEKHQKRFEWNP